MVSEAQLTDGLDYQLERGAGGLGKLSLTPLFFPRLQAPFSTMSSASWFAAVACVFCLQEWSPLGFICQLKP